MDVDGNNEKESRKEHIITFNEFASGSTIHGLNKLVDKNYRILQR